MHGASGRAARCAMTGERCEEVFVHIRIFRLKYVDPHVCHACLTRRIISFSSYVNKMQKRRQLDGRCDCCGERTVRHNRSGIRRRWEWVYGGRLYRPKLPDSGEKVFTNRHSGLLEWVRMKVKNAPIEFPTPSVSRYLLDILSKLIFFSCADNRVTSHIFDVLFNAHNIDLYLNNNEQLKLFIVEFALGRQSCYKRFGFCAFALV